MHQWLDYHGLCFYSEAESAGRPMIFLYWKLVFQLVTSILRLFGPNMPYQQYESWWRSWVSTFWNEPGPNKVIKLLGVCLLDYLHLFFYQNPFRLQMMEIANKHILVNIEDRLIVSLSSKDHIILIFFTRCVYMENL